MGRSSIISIAFLLSLDYGIRICAYFNMGIKVVIAATCRFSFDKREGWFVQNWSEVQTVTTYSVTIIILAISLPFALWTTIKHLKVYAKILFYLSALVFILIIVASLMHHEHKHP